MVYSRAEEDLRTFCELFNVPFTGTFRDTYNGSTCCRIHGSAVQYGSSFDGWLIIDITREFKDLVLSHGLKLYGGVGGHGTLDL